MAFGGAIVVLICLALLYPLNRANPALTVDDSMDFGFLAARGWCVGWEFQVVAYWEWPGRP